MSRSLPKLKGLRPLQTCELQPISTASGEVLIMLDWDVGILGDLVAGMGVGFLWDELPDG